MRRREILAGAAALLTSSRGFAQIGPKRRLAIVSLWEPFDSMREGGPSRGYDVLFRELRRRGHAEGQNLVVDRYSSERRAAGPASVIAEVINSRPDVAYAIGAEARELKHATATIPIVAMSPDPIAFGLVTNLARPGGNVTGVSVDTGPSIHGKRIELLREIVPRLAAIAVVASRVGWDAFLGRAARTAAATAGIQLIPALIEVPPSDDQYRRMIDAAARQGAGAVMVGDTPDSMTRRAVIVEAVAKAGLPAIYPFRESVEAGGLIAYTFDLAELNERAASAIDAILRGASPGDIPYYQNSKFQLFINMRTANALGLGIPPSLLARADEVIE